MATRSKFVGGTLTFLDNIQHERVMPMASVVLEEDFACAAPAIPTTASLGFMFIKKTVQSVGAPAVARLANQASGVAQLSLDATSEKQEATLYAGDELNFDVTKGACFEARIKLSTLPTGVVQAVWGLSAAWADGPDNLADYVEFGATGNGAILLRSQDGTTQNSVASGTTILATDWHTYRIECVDPTHLAYFIDGLQVPVAPTVMAFAATGASAILQPMMSCYKASGVGVGTMQVDFVRMWQNRQ